MDTVLEADREAARRVAARSTLAGTAGCGSECTRGDLHQPFADLDGAIETAPADATTALGGDDDRGEETLRAPREEVEIEAEERIAGTHARALTHARLESLTGE